MTIIPAQPGDAPALLDIFRQHITGHREYLSHGELQMGVAIPGPAGELPVLSPDWEAKWLHYIEWNLSAAGEAVVFKAEEDGQILGFAIAQVFTDDDLPYGMLGDILVRQGCRANGLGSRLLETALDWLRPRCPNGIFLESGVANEPAHEFFRRRGFVQVSEVYKLE